MAKIWRQNLRFRVIITIHQKKSDLGHIHLWCKHWPNSKFKLNCKIYPRIWSERHITQCQSADYKKNACILTLYFTCSVIWCYSFNHTPFKQFNSHIMILSYNAFLNVKPFNRLWVAPQSKQGHTKTWNIAGLCVAWIINVSLNTTSPQAEMFAV